MRRLLSCRGSFFVLYFMITGISGAESLPNSPLLERILTDMNAPLKDQVIRPEHEVQILYTQIDRPGNGPPRFHEHAWQVDANRYFYPASTVKLPVALIALEKLAALEIAGLDRSTAMLTDAARPWQTERHEDPTALNGKPSMGHDVRKIFLVSDNDAYNRLFEFVGLQGVNERLRELGLAQTHIVHRLASAREHEHGRYGNPIRFLNRNGDLLYEQPESVASQTYDHGQTIRKGLGYIVNGILVNEPKEFTHNNAFPLADQQRFLRGFIFPETLPDPQRVHLSEEDREYVLNVMSQYPRECQETADPTIREHADTYVKPFLAWQEAPIRDTLRCYNKIGRAYGYLVDNAYIVDQEHDVEFFLAAVIHTNANQIYNDDLYEYETIAEPFFKALGQAIYDYERHRE